MKTASEGDAGKLRSTLRRKALTSLYFFSKVCMNYDKLVQHLHLPFCSHITDTIKDLKRGYLWPRGHFKSTIVGKSYAPWRLIGGGSPWVKDILACETAEELVEQYKATPDCDPRNNRIFLGGESEKIGQKNLKDLKDLIENNQMFRWLFPEIIPQDLNKTKWTEGEILLPRTRSYDESTITATGVGAKVTGFHFNIRIYDDLIGEDTANSDAKMEDALHFFQYAAGLADNQATDEELIAGTRWRHGTADLYGWIMKNMPYEEINGDVFGFKFFVRSAEETDPETGIDKVIFPERFSKSILEGLKRRLGEYKYNCNYMNRPTSPEGADFSIKHYKTFSVDRDAAGQLNTITPRDGTPPIKLGQLFRVSFYDPSTGGKSAQCEGAIAIVGMAPDRRIFVLEMWGANCGYKEAVEQNMKFNDQYVLHKRLYEKKGAQGAVEDVVHLRARIPGPCPNCGKERHDRFTIEPFSPDAGIKEDRIRSYMQAAWEEGRVYMHPKLVEGKRQLEEFPFCNLVDRVDALASAVKNLRIPLSTDEVESRNIEMAAVHQVKEARTHTSQSYGGYV